MDEQQAPTPQAEALQELSTLATDKTFRSDFIGDNGHESQQAAAQHKRDLHAVAYGPAPDMAQAIPDSVQEALESNNDVEHAAGEAYIPAADISEYNFNWQNSDKMEMSDLSALDTTVKQAALAINAPAGLAKSIVEFVDSQLANGTGEPSTHDAGMLLDAMSSKHGDDKANATVDAAKAVMAMMPAEGHQLFTDALDHLDIPASIYLFERLASLHKAHS